MKRRPSRNFLRIVDRPTWLVVIDRRNEPLSITELPPRTDPRTVMVRAMARSLDKGWTIDELPGRIAAYACTKGDERRRVHITDIDPHRPNTPTPPLYGNPGRTPPTH